MARKLTGYDRPRAQLASWEVGAFDRASNFWLMLLDGINERDLGKKMVALEGMKKQLGSWLDLLEHGDEQNATPTATTGKEERHA